MNSIFALLLVYLVTTNSVTLGSDPPSQTRPDNQGSSWNSNLNNQENYTKGGGGGSHFQTPLPVASTSTQVQQPGGPGVKQTRNPTQIHQKNRDPTDIGRDGLMDNPFDRWPGDMFNPFENGAAFNFRGIPGVPEFPPGMDVPGSRRNGIRNGRTGGWGYGYGGRKGGFSGDGISNQPMVCKEKGRCYGKMLRCPAKCFHSFSRHGKNFAGGGGGGGCNFDCTHRCAAFC